MNLPKGPRPDPHLHDSEGEEKENPKTNRDGEKVLKGKTRGEIETLRNRVAKLREFSKEEITRFEKITGQKCADSKELVVKLHNMSPEEFEEWEKKDPGFINAFLSEKQTFGEGGTFTTHGNEKVEWNIGLRHLIRDKKVRSITLYTLIDNLEKGGKKSLMNNGNVQKVEHDGKKYIARKSTERDDEGNFFDQFGYLAIFEGDQYEKGEIWTDEQLRKYEEEQLARKRTERAKIVADLKISIEGLTEEQVDGKIQEEYQKRTVELLRNGPEWSKMMHEAATRFGLPTNSLVMSILASMMKYESGMRPDAENESSKAFGLGQFLTGTRRSQYKQMVAKGIDVPEGGADGIFKYDPKWQLYCLAQFVKSNANRLSGSGINVFSGNARDIAFLYLAHHDGTGGVSMFINWWKANGRPDEIPKFPHDDEVNKQYAVAGFQTRRGTNGTNNILNYAYKVANNAILYRNNPEKLLTEIQTAETKFEKRMGV